MSFVTPDHFGAKGNGVVDDTAAFVAAAATGKDIFLPSGRYLLSTASAIAIAAGVTFYGPGTIALPASSNTIFSCAGNGVGFDGIDVDGAAGFAGRAIYAGPNNSDLRVRGCKFTFADASGVGVYLEQIAEGFQIEGNKQTRGANLLYTVGGRGGLIKGNCATDVVRAIQLNGGQYHTVSGNHIHGGVTGILALSFRQIGQNNIMRGMTLAGNVCVDQSEEGITFDCNGNTPTQWPENSNLPIGTVASVATGATDIVVTLAETGLAANTLVGYAAVLLNGNAVGHCALVTASGSASFTIPRSAGNIAPLLAAGDKVLFTTGAIQNAISGNVVRGAGTYGIGLWGSAWHNTIAINQLLDCKIGILAASVTSPGSTGSSVQAYSGFNTIKTNKVSCLVTGGIEADTAGIKVYTQQFGAGSPAVAAQNPGYEVTDNTVIGRDIEILGCTSPIVSGNRAPSYDKTGTTGLIQSGNFSYLTPVTI